MKRITFLLAILIAANVFASEFKIPVNSQNIQQAFSDAGQENKHPRLFYDDDRIVEIKNIVSTDRKFAAKTYGEILDAANKLLNQPIKEWMLDDANLRISTIHGVGNDDLPMLSMAYLFTKDNRYAERCYQQMKAMCSWKDWGANRHFLDTGIGARGFAMAYDALYHYLTAEQRSELVKGLRKYALEPGKLQIETGQGQAWDWYNQNNNWNGICNGGLICAALAVYETDPAFMSQLIAAATNKLPKYIKSFDPDGASEEGMMYWSYGLTNTFLAFESMTRVLGSTFGLTEMDGITKTGWFPYLVSGPAGTATMGDDYLYYGKTNKFLSYFWFARYYNDANLAKKHYDECMSRQAKMNGYHDLLFYDPQLVAEGQETAMPLHSYVKGADYMFIRQNNSDDNAIYIGMHGGDNNASHGHLDAGTFNVQLNGECLIIGNLGKPDPYPADYFTVTPPLYTAAPTNVATQPGRLYYYRVRTEGKSCLVFNPDARPEQNPNGKASLIKEENNENGGFYVLNMKDCYSRDVSGYKRGIKLDRSKKRVTIQDEFTPLKSNSTIYWLAHTPLAESMTLSADKKTAICLKNGKTSVIRINSPQNAEFEIVNRSESKINYLLETASIFSSIMNNKNPINKWYGKLQIKLTGVSQATTISIDISDEMLDEPSFTSIDEWNIEGGNSIANEEGDNFDVDIFCNNGSMSVGNLNEGDEIIAYNMSGNLVSHRFADNRIIYISNLQHGVYILNIKRGNCNKIFKTIM